MAVPNFFGFYQHGKDGPPPNAPRGFNNLDAGDPGWNVDSAVPGGFNTNGVGPLQFQPRLWPDYVVNPVTVTSSQRTVRPSAVSQPIVAESDDAAIFELLWQVGCRMPKAGE